MVFAGLRTGEVRVLKFSDISIEDQTVAIRRQIVRSYSPEKSGHEIKEPKSLCSYRTIKVIPDIIQEVEKRKQRNEKIFQLLTEKGIEFDPESREYISITEKGKVISDNTLYSFLTKTCQRNNIPKVSPHGLRHMFASILLEEQMPLEDISKILGHKNTSTTFEIYCGIIIPEDAPNVIEEIMDPVFSSRYYGGVAHA